MVAEPSKASGHMEKVVLRILSSSMQLGLWVLRRVDYYFGQSIVSLHAAEGPANPYATFNTLRERGPILRSGQTAAGSPPGIKR
jgi:hypothetical protein